MLLGLPRSMSSWASVPGGRNESAVHRCSCMSRMVLLRSAGTQSQSALVPCFDSTRIEKDCCRRVTTSYLLKVKSSPDLL